MTQTLEILYEDNHLLAVNKPPLLPTMGVAEGQPSVLAAAKQLIKRRDQKPGNVYLGVISRLDAPVTGALLIAKTSKAAARMNAQFRDRKVEKIYRAIVEGIPGPGEQELQHFLRKDDRHRRVHVTQKDSDTAQEARLRFRVLQRIPQKDITLIEVQLLTGRKHQIRVQMSAIGHPILGDRKYKSSVHFTPGIALHSHLLRFEHPVRKHTVEIQCDVPASWRGWLSSTGTSRELTE